jgi:hypothetical protein
MVEQEHQMLVVMVALIQQVLVVLQVMIAPLEVKEDMQVVEKEEMVQIQNNQHKMEILERQVVENGKAAQALGLEEVLVVMVLQFVKQVVCLGLLELTQEQ